MAESTSPSDPSVFPAQLRSRIRVDEVTGCWIWTGAGTKAQGNGYGRVRWERRNWLLHRLAYHLLVAPVSELEVIDHLCRVKSCCNPAHLEQVTIAENVRRDGLARRKDRCGEGHPMTGENLRVGPSGRRYCVACQRRREARRPMTPERRRQNRERQRRWRQRNPRQVPQSKPGPEQGSIF